MATVGDLVDRIAAILRDAGIEAPRREARLIVTAATGLDPARQLSQRDEEIDAEGAVAMAARRAGREPMAYVLGHREFWGVDFAVGPGALVPRPETETLIEAALAHFPERERPLRLVDLGTGTGCLLLTLLTLYPAAIGIGVDRSAAALFWADLNRRRLELAHRALLMQANWLDATAGPFDLIVANPPYIGEAEPRDPETMHEPEAALLAGPDGLDAYRSIVGPAFRQLAPGGLLALEIGAGQAARVTTILRDAGFAYTAVSVDLAGRDRVLTARKA